jgi:hypothetical protein
MHISNYISIDLGLILVNIRELLLCDGIHGTGLRNKTKTKRNCVAFESRCHARSTYGSTVVVNVGISIGKLELCKTDAGLGYLCDSLIEDCAP